jgi:hypothetical protein
VFGTQIINHEEGRRVGNSLSLEIVFGEECGDLYLVVREF